MRKVFDVIVIIASLLFAVWYVENIWGVSLYNGDSLSAISASRKIVSFCVAIPIILIQILAEKIIKRIKERKNDQIQARKKKSS